jgi:hypothetical protein
LIENLPGQAADFAMLNVISAAFFGIGECLIGEGEVLKDLVASRLLIIGMEALGQDAVDPVNRLR